PHIPALDGVRGLAILTVILFHCLDWAGPTETHTADLAVRAVARVGWAGVDLFFVLSGFLITGILLDARGKPHYYRNFYARRSLPIFPLYYAVVLVRLLVVPLLSRPPEWVEWPKALAAITYLTNVWQSLVPADQRTDVLLSPTWSLCVEEYF